jgi:hypothetical protein
MPRALTATRETRHLATTVAGSATLLTLLWWGLAVGIGLPAFGTSQPPALPSAWQLASLAIVILGPVALSTWWMLRRLRTRCPAREARVAAATFALSAPVSMAIAIVLAELTGSYADAWLGGPFGLVGAFAGTVTTTAFLSFLACALALRITRRAEGSRAP